MEVAAEVKLSLLTVARLGPNTVAAT